MAGFMDVLRKLNVPWLGNRRPITAGDTEDRPGERERLPTQNVATGALNFLPYLDDATGETETVRAAYRVMLRDPDCKSALWAKLCSAASLDLNVHPDGPGPKAKQVANLVRYSLEHSIGGMPAIVEGMGLGGLVEGWSANEKVFRVIDRGDEFDGKIGLRDLPPKDSRFYRIDTDRFRNIMGLTGVGTGDQTRWPAAAFVIWQHMPMFKSAIGTSDFRAAYRAYWMADTAWKLRMIYLEKYSSPMLWGKYSAKTDKRALADRLEKAKSATWLMTPADVQVEVLNLATSKSASDFQSAILDLRQEKVQAIAGAILQSVEGAQTGARSIGEVHKSTSELFVWYVASKLSAALNSQLVPDLTDFNFLRAGFPLVTLGGVNDSDMLDAARLDQILLSNGLVLSKSEGYKRYGRGEPENEADAWRAPAGGPPGGPGGPAPGTGPIPSSFVDLPGRGVPATTFRHAERAWAGYLDAGRN